MEHMERRANTFSIVTFGCKVNQYESQAIRELMQREGYVEVPAAQGPDVCIVNSCAVTQATENECRRLVRRLSERNRRLQTIVTGCLAEVTPSNGWTRRTGVHAVRKDEVSRIPALLRGQGGAFAQTDTSPFSLTVSGHAGHARAYLKVQDGCDGCCAYCIVPNARGASQSRPVADILAEAVRLTRNGFREIVLTGVNIGKYRRDGLDLTGLLRRLLEADGIGRIRLGSLELNDVDDRLVSLVAADSRLCPHFHIPLQSGDDAILRAMNRPYTAAEYLGRIAAIRRAVNLPALTTDVIVGFPGETEDAFARTVAVCRQAGFSRIHVFSFSPRPGTPAVRMAERLAPGVVRRRKENLQAVAAELANDFRRQMAGREADLLIEYGRDRSTGLLHGHTERYVGVLVEGPDDWAARIVRVKIAKFEGGHLRGDVVGGLGRN